MWFKSTFKAPMYRVKLHMPVTTTLKFFAYSHLPQHLKAVSQPIGELAQKMEAELPDGPEKSAGMRKLLEANDCFVRAKMEQVAG